MENQSFKEMDNGISIKLGEGILKVLFYSKNIVRVLYSPSAVFSSIGSLVVIGESQKVEWDMKFTFKDIYLATDDLAINVNKLTGVIQFYDSNDNMILQEDQDRPRQMEETEVMGELTYNAEQRFILSEGEAIYGLGQYPDGYMNYRGKDVTMVQTNPAAVNPFLVSTNGYGILWDNYSKTLFHDDEDGMSLWSEVADVIDYYFIRGNNIDEVISGYRKLTGKAPMFGKWAYGYWQSKERYVDSDDLLNAVKEFRERNIPMDNIVQDWRYWGENDFWSSMKFDPELYPDPLKTISTVHDKYNVHYMISIWPALGPKTEIYKELKEKGLTFPNEHWTTGFVYDAYSQEARDIYWRYIKEGLISKGVDALWMDATEIELRDQPTPEISEASIKEFGKNSMGTFARYLNPYSLMTTRGAYEGFRRDFPDKRFFILTRSVFSGQQRYASVTWSGDIAARWDVLKNQIPAGLNFCMAGVPYWTHDIGAFFCKIRGGMYPNGCKDPAYRELYVRWFQFGAFSPIFRSHGTETPREIWNFGEPGTWAYDALVKVDNLRYRLLPYIYSLAWKITEHGYTLMRGLVMDFAADTKTLDIGNQYMFGPSIMVIPVTEEQYFQAQTKISGDANLPAGQDINLVVINKSDSIDESLVLPDTAYDINGKQIKSIELYLPSCDGWYDFWTGEYFEGGQTINRETPIDIIPLYVKAGSIIPFGPFKQYASEKPEDPIELRIYPGKDAEFVLYEDENDNNYYEKGSYAIIPIKWEDKTRTLKICERKGEFPGMLKERTFNIVKVSTNHGTGIEISDKFDKSIKYDGKELVVVV